MLCVIRDALSKMAVSLSAWHLQLYSEFDNWSYYYIEYMLSSSLYFINVNLYFFSLFFTLYRWWRCGMLCHRNSIKIIPAFTSLFLFLVKKISFPLNSFLIESFLAQPYALTEFKSRNSNHWPIDTLREEVWRCFKKRRESYFVSAETMAKRNQIVR